MQILARSRHPALTVLDQAASGLSNFILVLMVGRVADLRQLGQFALLYAFYVVMLACVRSSIGQSLLLRPDGHGRYRSPIEAAVLAGALVLPVLLPISLLTSDPAMTLVAFGLPALLAQDVLRYVFIARKDVGPALAADGFWALILTGALALSLLRPQIHLGIFDITLVWLFGASVGTVYLYLRCQRLTVSTENVRLRTWFRVQRSLGLGLLAETAISLALGQLTPVILVAIVGIDQVGIYRLAQTALAPLTNASAAFSVAAVPYYRTAMAVDGHRTRLPYLVLAMPAIALLYGALLLFIPAAVLDAVFGARFHLAKSILPPLTMAQVLLCASLGVGLIPRVQANVRLILRVRFWTILNEPGLVALFSSVGGLTGAAWGVCAAQGITLLAWCKQVLPFRAVERSNLTIPEDA